MIIECSYCEARVDGKIVGEQWTQGLGEPRFLSVLLQCPQCDEPLFGGRWEFEDALQRLWPRMERQLSDDIPESIRNSLSEAAACFKAGAYNATTVMAGRALEGVCRHFGAPDTYLGPGIEQLRQQGIIDARLASWATELQRARNLSAHASGERVSRRDAQDLLDFVNAICEYVFVLTRKYEMFMARRNAVAVSSEPPVGDSTEVPR